MEEYLIHRQGVPVCATGLKVNPRDLLAVKLNSGAPAKTANYMALT